MYKALGEHKQDYQPEIKQPAYYICVWHTQISIVSQIMTSKLKEKALHRKK